MREHRPSLSRRRFLRAVGLAAGACAAGPLLGASAAAPLAPASGTASSAALFTVGVVLPQSPGYGALADSFLNGLRLAFAEAGGWLSNRPIALQTQPHAVSPGHALALTRGLLAEGRADLIVSLGSSGQAASLRPLLAERGVPLVVAGAGANVARAGQYSPHLFRGSLGMWRASYALGRWAAHNAGARAVMLSSFHDAGYDTLYAFRLGFTGAGGDVIDQFVTHLPSGGRGAEEIFADLGAARPDVVFAAAAGPQAAEIARAYARSGMAGRVPLLGSSFFTDEGWLDEQGDAALGVRTAAAWAPSLNTPANQAFTAAYTRAYGRQPDPFALLGYDTAGLIAAAGQSEAPLLGALRTAQLDSPRGRLAMDADQQDLATPIYLRSVRHAGSALVNMVEHELEPVPERDERLAELRASIKSGWLYPYLFI
jgi:branched-chain amino acid transport system substrate-binding protein